MFSPEIHIVEVLEDGNTHPYPTIEWSERPKNNSQIGTDSVLGVQIDKNGTLWFLDNASKPPKLVAWDMNSESLKRVYPIPENSYNSNRTFINDLAINLKDQKAYLADVVGDLSAAIIVLDLNTGKARRVLEGHESVLPEADQPIIVEGKKLISMNSDGTTREPRLGLNPITIDPSEKWVYYGAMHGTSVYRISTDALNDVNLDSESLFNRVQRYGDKPVSDGISIDNANNVYITDLNNHSIGVTRPDGKYEIIYTDKDLFIWPDSIAAGPDGMMYVVLNQLNRAAALNAGVNESKPPFHIVRFKPLADVTVGR